MYEKYRDMIWQLRALRLKNEGRESPEEDELLEAMDVAWKGLTPEEQRQLTEE
jgi:hypothetical protein